MFENINESVDLSTISKEISSGDYTLLGYNCYDDAYIQHMRVLKTEIQPYGVFDESLRITYLGDLPNKEESLLLMPYDCFAIWKDFIDMDSQKNLLMNILGKTYFRDTPSDPQGYMIKLAGCEPILVKH